MAAFVQTAEDLAQWLPLVAAHSQIALDTEADSLHCYFEKLCLIQVTVDGTDFLVDPLAGFPLAPFFDALSGKQLLFHGADYDLRLLRRVGFPGPHSIFDTMIAARLCGIEEFSLAALIERYFGVKLSKGSQKANWARRPLPPEMVDYAVNDTRYLHRLRDIFSEELVRISRWEWFEQSCQRAVRMTETVKERDLDEAWRISGSGLLRGRAAAILRELWKWRDEEARSVDRPAFHVLNNEQLLSAAHRIDQGQTAEFHHLRGGRLKRFQDSIARSLAMPPEEWPVFVKTVRSRPSRDEEARFKELKTKRDQAAQALGIDPSLIAPKATLEALVSRPDEGLARLMPWQRDVLKL
jgi:ribonuclease D